MLLEREGKASRAYEILPLFFGLVPPFRDYIGITDAPSWPGPSSILKIDPRLYLNKRSHKM